MEIELRHYCRNPHCRSKLKEPVDNPRKAFCTKGCHSSFYLKRCLVCEGKKPEGSKSNRRFCRRPKCQADYRRNSILFDYSGHVSSAAPNAPRNPINTRVKTGDFDDRPWRIVAGPKITATAFQFATLPVDPDVVRKYHIANDWDRIRREIAWSGRRRSAPNELQSDWKPCSPANPIAEHLAIPDFLRRTV